MSCTKHMATTALKQKTYSTVLLCPFGFRCSSSISPGLQVWLRGVFTGGGFGAGRCLGRARGDSFRGHFPAPCWGSRAQGLHSSACWRCCLHRDQKGTVFLGLCCSISQGRRKRSSCSPCTLCCCSRMSSVAWLRISSGLRVATLVPFLLCTSLMEATRSELQGQERQGQGWPWRALQAPCWIPAGPQEPAFPMNWSLLPVTLQDETPHQSPE